MTSAANRRRQSNGSEPWVAAIEFVFPRRQVGRCRARCAPDSTSAQRVTPEKSELDPASGENIFSVSRLPAMSSRAFTFTGRLRSFRYAFHGLGLMLRSQHNA